MCVFWGWGREGWGQRGKGMGGRGVVRGYEPPHMNSGNSPHDLSIAALGNFEEMHQKFKICDQARGYFHFAQGCKITQVVLLFLHILVTNPILWQN
jgi:hypothetical protein